jgi:hypothetical protein
LFAAAVRDLLMLGKEKKKGNSWQMGQQTEANNAVSTLLCQASACTCGGNKLSTSYGVIRS